MSASGFSSRVGAVQQHVERVLDMLLPQANAADSRLCDAMRYSVLGGGKRLRPLLVYVTGETLGAQTVVLDAPAAAVEMIHAYSLIHDDLPSMDDDDLRRGRPSCHRAFDEGTAVLAGDALQALAFDVLAERTDALPAAARVQMLSVLARAIGTAGMAGGQAIDLAAVGKSVNAATIERMHRLKTGALIQASVQLGAICAGHHEGSSYDALATFGAEIGLAFQIQDDILDVTGSTATLGKKAGADAELGKPTYPSVLGLALSQRAAVAHRDQALAALTALGPMSEELRELAYFVVDRAH